MKRFFQPKFANLMLIRMFKMTFIPGVVITSLGIAWALWGAPQDSIQAYNSRILYVHVPAAWMALMTFLALGVLSLAALIWRLPLVALSTLSLARLSMLYSALTLITGMMWAKPMWGTWWVWDARLTTMFLQFLMTVSIVALHPQHNLGEPQKRSAHIFAVIGLINLPLIKGSVIWWNTLHQGATFDLSGGNIDSAMGIAMFIVFLGYAALAVAITSLDIRTSLLQQRIVTLTYRRSHAA